MAAAPHPDPERLLAEAQPAWTGALAEPPAALTTTRAALHQVAEQLLAPARRAATGNEIALRWYPGGFGTPPFSDEPGERAIRVEGAELVDVRGAGERRAPLTSLAAAGALIGDLVDAGSLADEPLAIDPAAAEFLARWFCFATLAIASLRVGAAAELDPGWVQLWPEHFDIATELGRESDGRRAAYGASPGDPDHAEPYIYVAPWNGTPEGELWNASAFAGAELSYADLRAADDPVAGAAAFFRARLAALEA